MSQNKFLWASQGESLKSNGYIKSVGVLSDKTRPLDVSEGGSNEESPTLIPTDVDEDSLSELDTLVNVCFVKKKLDVSGGGSKEESPAHVSTGLDVNNFKTQM